MSLFKHKCPICGVVFKDDSPFAAEEASQAHFKEKHVSGPPIIWGDVQPPPKE